jgi:hypothetical protein
MKPARDLQLDAAKLRLKLGTKKLIGAVHGTALAAEIAGTRQQRMSDCQLPNVPEYLRINEVQELEDAARGSDGWPQLTRAMARHHGFALLPLPEGALGDSDWHRSLADVSREVDDAIGKLAVLRGLCDAELARGMPALRAVAGGDR